MQHDPEIINLKVNGRPWKLRVGGGLSEVDPAHTLAHTLRETLGLTGTKLGCDQGSCGACTVLRDGEAVLSCMTLTVECDGWDITTIEGLHGEEPASLHPLQESFMEYTAFQCGYCTPGIIMSAKALLDENPSPSHEQTTEALSGHHCRCISHYQVLEAVRAAAQKKGEGA
jgi:aerobic-type carbon monoxide dehydrogenase small subunit (CoxS/CutS family)